MNLVILEGRLGKDPTLATTQGGQKVSNFSLATTEKFTNKEGQKVEKTEWHRITCWGNLGETVSKYLATGRRVMVQGRIQYSEYIDKESQQKRYSTSIVADKVTFLDAPKGTKTTTVETEVLDVPEEVLNPQGVGAGDDIPF